MDGIITFFLQVVPSKELVETLSKSEKTFYITLIGMLWAALVSLLLYIRKQNIDRNAELKQQFGALISQTTEFMKSVNDSSLAMNKINATIAGVNETIKDQTRSNEKLAEVVSNVHTDNKLSRSVLEGILRQQEKLSETMSKTHDLIMEGFSKPRRKSTP